MNDAINAIFEQRLPSSLQMLPDSSRETYSHKLPEISPSQIPSKEDLEEEEFQRQLDQFCKRTGRVLKKDLLASKSGGIAGAAADALRPGMKLNVFENEKEREKERRRLALVVANASREEAQYNAKLESMYNDEYDDTFDSLAHFNPDLKAEEGDMEVNTGRSGVSKKASQSEVEDESEDVKVCLSNFDLFSSFLCEKYIPCQDIYSNLFFSFMTF